MNKINKYKKWIKTRRKEKYNGLVFAEGKEKINILKIQFSKCGTKSIINKDKEKIIYTYGNNSFLIEYKNYCIGTFNRKNFNNFII